MVRTDQMLKILQLPPKKKQGRLKAAGFPAINAKAGKSGVQILKARNIGNSYQKVCRSEESDGTPFFLAAGDILSHRQGRLSACPCHIRNIYDRKDENHGVNSVRKEGGAVSGHL